MRNKDFDHSRVLIYEGLEPWVICADRGEDNVSFMSEQNPDTKDKRLNVCVRTTSTVHPKVGEDSCLGVT